MPPPMMKADITTSFFRLASGSDAMLFVIARPVNAATRETAIDAITRTILCATAINEPSLHPRSSKLVKFNKLEPGNSSKSRKPHRV